MPIQVLLADDHPMVRQGFKALLEREGFKVLAEASDGREAVRLARALHPEVAVLDLAMPLLNGLDAARAILRDCRRTKIILLTAHAETQCVLQSFEAGVRGYLLKVQKAEDLMEAIREVARGAIYLSPDVAPRVAAAVRSRTTTSNGTLTARERQVLQLVAEGHTTRQIAAVLGVSVKTAESHRTRLMHKLDIHEKAGLVRYALRHGLIEA